MSKTKPFIVFNKTPFLAKGCASKAIDAAHGLLASNTNRPISHPPCHPSCLERYQTAKSHHQQAGSQSSLPGIGTFKLPEPERPLERHPVGKRGIELVEPGDEHCCIVGRPLKKRKMSHEACSCNHQYNDDLWFHVPSPVDCPVHKTFNMGTSAQRRQQKLPKTSFTHRRYGNVLKDVNRRTSLSAKEISAQNDEMEWESLDIPIQLEQSSITLTYDGSHREPTGPGLDIDPMFRFMSKGPQDKYVPLNSWFTEPEKPNGVAFSTWRETSKYRESVAAPLSTGTEMEEKPHTCLTKLTAAHKEVPVDDCMDIDPAIYPLPSGPVSGNLHPESFERSRPLPSKPATREPRAPDSCLKAKPWYFPPPGTCIPRIRITPCEPNNIRDAQENRVPALKNRSLLLPPRLGRWSRLETATEIRHKAARKEFARRERQREMQREQAGRIKQKLEQDEKARKEAERNEVSATRALLKIQRGKASQIDLEGSDWRNAMLSVRSGLPANVADEPNSAGTEKEVVGPGKTDPSNEVVIPGLNFCREKEKSIPGLHLQSKKTEAELKVPSPETAVKTTTEQQNPQVNWRPTHPNAEVEVPMPRTIMEAVRQQELETKRERKASKGLKRLKKNGAWCPPHSQSRGSPHFRRFGEVR